MYIEFQYKPFELRDKSIEEGRFVSEDRLYYTIVVPGGGNSTVEGWWHDATDQKKEQFRLQYDAFMKQEEAPLDGTDIRQWAAVSRAQAENCFRANIKTIEDLASVPDTALQKLGPGYRALQQKAQAWMKSAEDTGKIAEENAALKEKMSQMDELMKEMQSTIDELKKSQPKKAKK